MVKNKILLFALFGFMNITAQEYPGRYVLNGKFEKNISGKVILSVRKFIDNKYTDASDTTAINGGSFQFSGIIDEPVFAILSHDTTEIQLFLESSDMTLTINDNDNYVLKGSLQNEYYVRYTLYHDSIYTKYDQLREEKNLLQKQKEETFDENLKKTLTDSLSLLDKDFKIYFEKNQLSSVDFAENNPGAFQAISIFPLIVRMFSSSFFPAERARKIFNAYPEELKNTPTGKIIDKVITAKENTGVGAFATDFTAPDINGNIITLSDYRGKNYVFFDAWASWCTACIESIPHTKQLYNKYKDKGLVIIGVSQDTDLKAWRNAIDKYEIKDWIHVSSQQDPSKGFMSGYFIEDDIISKYPIISIPKYYLIDTDGTVVGSWELYNDQTAKDMDETFQRVFGE